MTREKQIQEYQNKQLIEELSKMPPMVIATAYLHAINYTLYGEDVTEKWVTAIQNASALEKAYQEGYCDALQRQTESLEQKPKTGHCKDCKYFEYDSWAKVNGIPLIVAHEICKKWGDGCKTKEDGYCFLFEPQESKG